MKNINLFKKNVVLAVLVIIIAAAPLLFLKSAEFGGSDDKAEQAISEVNNDYRPWFSSIWKPPSSEVESLLFALQSAIGAGIIGYYFGYHKGKNANSKGKKE